MSLRSFHMLFILLAIMGADLFGGWALRDYRQHGDPSMLAFGVISLVGGLGLAAYALLLVRRLDRERIS